MKFVGAEEIVIGMNKPRLVTPYAVMTNFPLAKVRATDAFVLEMRDGIQDNALANAEIDMSMTMTLKLV